MFSCSLVSLFLTKYYSLVSAALSAVSIITKVSTRVFHDSNSRVLIFGAFNIRRVNITFNKKLLFANNSRYDSNAKYKLGMPVSDYNVLIESEVGYSAPVYSMYGVDIIASVENKLIIVGTVLLTGGRVYFHCQAYKSNRGFFTR